MTTIRRLLVANRGEIARRVFRTCRSLGIETVAVYSDADADLPFVREADVAVRLPGNTPTDTYLRGDLVVEAARASGADAVHPGYGFLSESAAFSRQVAEAGLTWVGPTPESIEAMGSKVEAKKLMEKAGVPVLAEIPPGEVSEDDLPLLVKASAGGGGRGMRVVRTLDEVSAQVDRAAAEAASAFGDPTVFCEPYVEQGRHVEVQVVGDTHGNVLVLGERDCSLQRRHQKVLEETPAPGLSAHTRTALHEAARNAAEAIGYVGAGTVEFLLADDRFWFLEMNTRLQVEHPVTELVTGLDLVALQVAVAEGRALSDPPPAPRGHAVEARLYAEDPAAGWQPQSGRLTRLDVPEVTAQFDNPVSYGIRLDSGFEAGNEVGTHYDAMLAKVIAWAPTRDQALRRLAGTLARARIHGVRTNRDLLASLLRDPVVVEGRMHTTYLDTLDVAAASRSGYDDDALALAGFAAVVADVERERLERTVQRAIAPGWRNVTSQPQVAVLAVGGSAEGDPITVEWYGGRDGYRTARDDVTCLVVTADRVVLDQGGVRHEYHVAVTGDRIDVDAPAGHVSFHKQPRFTDPADHVAAGSLLAPMPAGVVDVAVSAGEEVTAGQTVLVLEAMKMQHTVSAPHDGVVTEVPVSVGDQVSAGDVLAVVQQTDPPQDAAAQGDSE